MVTISIIPSHNSFLSKMVKVRMVRKKSFFYSFLGFFIACVSARLLLMDFDLMHGYATHTSRQAMSVGETIQYATQSTPISIGQTIKSPTQPKKPLLVFHLGPPKTATTSLQTDLTKFKQVLERDNYLYMGRYYDPFVDIRGRTRLNRTGSPLEDQAHYMLHQNNCHRIGPECLDGFKALLAPHAASRTNVLLSDEAFGIKWTEPAHYQAIYDALSGDWQVVMVAAYRHYYDWMPSLLFQRFRMDRTTAQIKDSWPSDKGQAVKLVFPDEVHAFPNRTLSLSFTSHLVKNIGGILPLRIFDLHDTTTSTRTNFMCRALPEAPHACALSQSMDKRNEEDTVMNTKEAIPLHLFYDVLATAAADAGLVDTRRYTRDMVRHAVRDFQETALEQTAVDLDLHCPDKLQQETYLRQSLEHQRVVYGQEYLTTSQLEAHKEGFAARVKSRAWCWPDTDTIFRRKDWKAFFADRFSHVEALVE